MKNRTLVKTALFLGTLFGGIVTSFATSVECATKINPNLCKKLNQASADSDTFWVSINFFHPTNEPTEYCRNLDPKHDTDGQCIVMGYDSAYYAKLKSDAQTLFTNFELWDAKEPAVRLTPPGSGKISHNGIVATKATLIEILNEAYVSTIEVWQEYGPAKISSHPAKRIEGMRIQGNSFLPNGRVISPRVPVMGPSYSR